MGADWKEMVKKAQANHERLAAERPAVNGYCCFYCGVALADLHEYARRCGPCGTLVVQVQWKAANAVASATRRGDLPKVKELACVDCGKPAQCWDHRDYDKPLDVEPTCRGCNKRRGPAKADSIRKLP